MGKHRETDAHLKAFEAWYEAGRDAPKVAETCRIAERTVRAWEARFGWNDRADKRDAAAAKKADREAIDRRAQMLRRHRQAAELLQARGIEHFRDRKVERANDAISAIKTGVDLERQAEGMPAWVVEILNADEDTLRQRRADLLDARQRAGAAGDRDSAGDAAVAGSANGKH